MNEDIDKAIKVVRDQVQTLRSSYEDKQTKFIYELHIRREIEDLKLAEALLYELRIKREHTNIKCKFCGAFTKSLETKMCDRCWELQRNVEKIPLRALLKILSYSLKEQFQIVEKTCQRK